jgi:hypothetical protein
MIRFASMAYLSTPRGVTLDPQSLLRLVLSLHAAICRSLSRMLAQSLRQARSM